MNSKLDQEKIYDKFDKEDISYSIEHLPGQFIKAWDQAGDLHFPASYKNINKVVLIGMGGSHLSAFMLKHITEEKRKMPFEIIHDYKVPGYIDHKTLVILSSFSGSTEEVLHSAHELKNSRAKVTAIGTGGQLMEIAEKANWPHFIFEPGDSSLQPRMGLGFYFAGLAHIFKKLGVYSCSRKNIEAMIDAMSDVIDTCALDIPTEENPAKTVAEALHDRAILVVASEHLRANAHILQNQINETSKQFCTFLTLPELNHHFMEGLTFPKNFFSKYTVLMLHSELYHERTQKRFELTADIFERQGAEVIDYKARGADLFSESAELLQFSSFLSYYLGMLNEVEPQFIPFVKEFKKKLG